MNTKKWTLKKHFEGIPKLSDFEIAEESLPPLKNGEILTEALYISPDPFIRVYAQRLLSPGDTINGFQVAKVCESKHPNFKLNDLVVGVFGWKTRTVCAPDEDSPGGRVHLKPYKLPDLGNISPSVALGMLGMPGVTAYFGLLEILDPKPGEIVVVSGAAGAVGSHAVQIAKHKGCIVIGIAGSDAKIKFLTDELKIDAAFNYKNADLAASLAKIAPQGVDCYFDMVGGEISSIVMYQMKSLGRVAVCGSISSYNTEARNLPKVLIVQPAIVMNELTIRGFVCTRWNDRWMEAVCQNLAWINEGWLKYRETITEGFEKLPEAFISMLQGGNTGKAAVKIN